MSDKDSHFFGLVPLFECSEIDSRMNLTLDFVAWLWLSNFFLKRQEH
jgi:hypothetical protein